MTPQISFILNDELVTTEIHPGIVLLDFIRKQKQLTGTKEVCKEGDCGACSVLVGSLENGEVKYKTINSCLYPIGKVNGKHVVTIEGLNQENLTPIQQYFVDEGSSQCGFCTPGFIVALTGYLLNTDEPKLESAVISIAGNICRCTGYKSIERSTQKLVEHISQLPLNIYERVKALVEQSILPGYFLQIKEKLKKIEIGTDTVDKPSAESSLRVAGGTDLYVQIPDDLEESSIELLEGEHRINEDGRAITISGYSTFEEFCLSEVIKKYFPGIDKQLLLVASQQIRNSATIAGNIVNASPIADLTIILLALNAAVNLKSQTGTRKIPLREFYLGYKQLNKNINEVIDSMMFVLPGGNYKLNFEKVSKRTHLDIASVNSAILIQIEDNTILSVQLSFGGVAPIPLYMEKTSAYLQGKKINSSTIAAAVETALSEISPISDVRGSKEYKSLLTRQILITHFFELFPGTINLKRLA